MTYIWQICSLGWHRYEERRGLDSPQGDLRQQLPFKIRAISLLERRTSYTNSASGGII